MSAASIVKEDESREGIVKDILIKSAEGISQGMICHGAWFKGPELWDNDALEGFPDGGRRDEVMGPELFWSIAAGKKIMWSTWDDIGKVSSKHENPVNESDRRKLMEAAAKAERCAEGELALNTALLGGTARDWELSKWIAGEALRSMALAIPAQLGCPESTAGMCVASELMHFNDQHVVPEGADMTHDDLIEAGGQIAEVFRAASDLL